MTGVVSSSQEGENPEEIGGEPEAVCEQFKKENRKVAGKRHDF